MILTLEVTGPQARQIGAATRVFEASGGTIGRLPDNHWVLPDPHVSGRHAVIRYVNGTFFIEDTSTNGVFINTPENRLARGQPYALKSGDRIHIDLYEIRASITPAQTVPAADPFAHEDPFALVSGPTPKPIVASLIPDLSPLGAPLSGEDVDPLSVLGLQPAPLKSSQAPSAEQLAGDDVWSQHYRPPAPVAVAPVDTPRPKESKIPLDYDPLSSDYRPSIPPADAPPPAMLRTPPASPRSDIVDVRKRHAARLPDTPAGMRVAFDSMLAQFNPDRLQAEFDGALKKGALLSLPARLRYWDLYREKFHEMVRDQEATFRRLFGDQFAEAYEEQLRRLK